MSSHLICIYGTEMVKSVPLFACSLITKGSISEDDCVHNVHSSVGYILDRRLQTFNLYAVSVCYKLIPVSISRRLLLLVARQIIDTLDNLSMLACVFLFALVVELISTTT